MVTSNTQFYSALQSSIQGWIMTTIDTHSASSILHGIATQVYNLAMGLQNAAPSQDMTGLSIQYLKEISIELENVSKKIADITVEK